MTSFDRTVLGVIAGLIAAIGTLVLLGDQAGAGVASVEPPDGAIPAATTGVRIHFSQPMNPASVESSFSIEPSTKGALTWDGNTLTFRANAPFTPGQKYTVTLAAWAASRTGRALKRSVSWSFRPRQPDVSYLAPANSSIRALWAAERGGDPRKLFAPQQGIDSYSASPDGSRIAVTVNGLDQAADLWLIDRDGGNPTKVTTCAPGFCGRPAWSPDGRLIAYERRDEASLGESASGRIWLYDVITGSTSALFQDEKLLGFGVLWSADSQRLAFFDPDSAGIRIVELATGKMAVLASQMGETGSFSPDGQEMVFTDIRPVGAQFFPDLWLGQTGEAKTLVALLPSAEEDQFPAWSPDGKWIAFGRRALDRQQGLGSQPMLFNLDSHELKPLTTDSTYNHTSFRWSPNGDALLIGRFKLGASNGTPEVWVYDPSQAKLSPVIMDGLDASWLP